eukprot:m.321924 g.321924  ORF g.321924 m.321924 type:complete len:207 (-) comp16530_c1_seq33:1883-2503(-)
MFYNCSSLVSINIPSGVTEIEQKAFDGCLSLVNIHIPKSVTSISNNAFDLTPCQDVTSPISLFSCQKVSYEGWMVLMYTNQNMLDDLSQDFDDSITRVEEIEQSSMEALQFSQEVNKVVGANSFKLKALHEWRQNVVDPVIFEIQDIMLEIQENITTLDSRNTNYTEEINMLTEEIDLLRANNTALQTNQVMLQTKLDDTQVLISY